MGVHVIVQGLGGLLELYICWGWSTCELGARPTGRYIGGVASMRAGALTCTLAPRACQLVCQHCPGAWDHVRAASMSHTCMCLCALVCLLRAGVLNTLWGLSVPPQRGSFSVAQIHAAVRVAGRVWTHSGRACIRWLCKSCLLSICCTGEAVTSIPAAPSIPKGDSVATQHARLWVVACGACFVCNKTAGRSSVCRAEVLCFVFFLGICTLGGGNSALCLWGNLRCAWSALGSRWVLGVAA